jgi:uncharacterized membrane protein
MHSVKAYAVTYFATALVFLGIDSVWLTLAAHRLYRPLMGSMLLERFHRLPAIFFYVIYAAGIVVFAISPALSAGRWTIAAMYGAFLGLLAYATYDLTNQATLQNWPLTVTIADLCWGTFLTAVAATAGYLIARAMT